VTPFREAPVRIFLPLDPPGVSRTSRPAPANSAIARALLPNVSIRKRW